MTERAFSQEDYNLAIHNLDEIVDHMKQQLGISEKQARAWLVDFVTNHYAKVWRR